MNTLDISTKHTNDYLDATEFNQVVSKINELVTSVNSLLIVPTDITNGKVYGLLDSYEWDGEEPLVPSGYGVYVNRKFLTEDVQYKVYIKGNDNYGTATMTFVGIGDYYGEITKTFQIVEKRD